MSDSTEFVETNELPADFTPRSGVEVINMDSDEREAYESNLESWNDKHGIKPAKQTDEAGSDPAYDDDGNTSNESDGDADGSQDDPQDDDTDSPDDDTDDSQDDSGDDAPQVKGPKLTRTQKRINQLTRQKGDLARQNQVLANEINSLKAEKQALYEMAQKEGDGPDRDDYESEDDYIDAKLNHVKTTSKIEAQISMIDRQEQQKAKESAHVDREVMNAKWMEGVEKYPDFEKVVSGLAVKDVSQQFIAEVNEHPDFADLVYHFAKNKQEASRIAAIPNPVLRISELGRVKASLDLVNSSRKTQTKAPKPPKTLAGNNPQPKSVDDMDIGEYIKAMNTKELKAKGKL